MNGAYTYVVKNDSREVVSVLSTRHEAVGVAATLDEGNEYHAESKSLYLGECGLRDEYDQGVLPSASTGNRHMHVPADDDPESLVTVCQAQSHYSPHPYTSDSHKSFMRKDLAMFPDRYEVWCKYCLKEIGQL